MPAPSLVMLPLVVGAALFVVGCESPRLPTVFQGSSVPVTPSTSTDAAKSKAANKPQAAVIAAPAPASLPAATPPIKDDREIPSLVPYLTGRVPPGSQALPGAQAPLAPITPLATSSTVRIALLVPLSGPNEKLGRAMLNAAQLALFDFSDQRFELLIHDTQGTPEGAMEAARFAIGDGASMILGPLLGTSVSAVAPMARAANVKVIGFSSDRTVTGDGIYTMGFFPETEVARVVQYAATQGVVRFAALAPSGPYGETVVEALRQAAARAGGEVTRVQFYDPLTADFSGVVRELANYDSRRQALLNQRAELAERDDDIATRALKRLEKLQTIGDVPFDALMLADGGERLLAIAALLPFYDVDPKKVRMLGTGQWDAPGLGSEPALSGGWHAGPPPDARAEFVTQYEKAYGNKPHRLSTLAYDATALAAVLARAEGGPDFSAAALTTKSGFWGRDGIFRFLADGSVERGLAVLQIEPRSTKVISPSPEAFSEGF
ncbi:MAG: penicillin-binding protein activator [Rhodospirillales bacterium]|nr:penicillin-binding protein activator [Rhodospirillales bacterium]